MLLIFALLGTACAAPLAHEISPLSPLIHYDPVTWGGGDSDGWAWTIPKTAWSPPQLGAGALLNTSFPNATLSLNFTGTGVYLNGSVTANTTLYRSWDGRELTGLHEPYTYAGAYKVNIDADAHQFGTAFEHQYGLKVINGSLAIERVTVLTQIDVGYVAGREAPDKSHPVLLNDTKLNPQFDFVGGWEGVPVFEPRRFNDKEPHVRGKPGASVSWDVPKGVAWLLLDGFVGYESGTYAVSLSPAPANVSEWTYNASRPFELVAAFFMAPLDPKTEYRATLKNTDPEKTLKFRRAIYRFENQETADAFVLPKAEEPKNIGAIVGGTIGGVVGAALIAFAIWWWLRRRRPREPHWDDVRLDLDEEPQLMVPYVPHSQQGYASQTEEGRFAPRESHMRESVGTQWLESITSALSSDTHDAKSQTRDPLQPRIQQERDAGTVLVPPSYDPTWAGAGATPQLIEFNESLSKHSAGTPTSAVFLPPGADAAPLPPPVAPYAGPDGDRKSFSSDRAEIWAQNRV